MPSDKSENSAAVAKAARKERKKKGKSVASIFGVIILAILCVLMVIPVVGVGGNGSVVFGSYDGKDIEFSYGNFFYNQVMNLLYSNPGAGEFQAYYQAFNSTVMQVALSQMAEQAGIIITDKAVNEQIMRDTGFIGEDGAFDAAAYNALPEVQKAAINQSLKESLPAQRVLDDITSVKVSDAERAYSLSLNSNPRTIEYLVVDSALYPDQDARAYAEANASLFEAIDLSVVTMATEEEAKAVADGTTAPEDALASSIDQYRTDNGSMGRVYCHELETLLSDESARETLFALGEGEIAGPYQALGGYAVFRAERAAYTPDLEDEEVLRDIKAYIAANESETMDAYLAGKAEEVYQAASADFEGEAAAEGIEIASVGPASANPGYSQFIVGPEYTDRQGDLSRALVADAELYSTLFTAEDNAVLGPYESSGEYLIIRSFPAENDNNMGSYLAPMYTSYMPELVAQDMQNAIFGSDKLDNRFFEVFFQNTSAN